MDTSMRTTFTRAIVAAGIALALVGLTGCSLIGNVLNGSGSGVVQGDGTSTDVFTIKVGDCLNDSTATGTVSSVPTIDCAKPHDTEAYKSILLDDGSFPGDAAIQTQSEDGCKAAFVDFAGIAYESSTSLDFSYYYPTSDSWSNGDREILCLILSVDANGKPVKTTGTLKGAAR